MTLTEDEVEDRLRRTFATRVADMATGNGAVLPTVLPPAAGDTGAPSPAAHADADPVADGHADARDRRRRRLVLAVAATLLIAAGVAAAALAAVGADDRDSGDRGTTGVAGLPSTTAPETTTTSAPASDGSSCVALEFSQGDDRWITVVFDGSAAGGDIDVPALLGDQWRPVDAGPNRGYIATVEAGSPALWLIFEDGIVRLQGGGVAEEELIAVGATVTRDPSGCYTAPTPDGWSREETLLLPVEDGGTRDGDGAFIGLFNDAAGGSYNVIWYPHWSTATLRASLPDDVEDVTVSDGQAYVGTIAPDATDLLQLWIAYDDGGVVELQASGVSRDDLVAAGNGVHRRAGTDEFDLTPPPGFTRQE
jgi:hypothetical protein